MAWLSGWRKMLSDIIAPMPMQVTTKPTATRVHP
jgi:hypothetical protein